jgi:hypothetical protein
VIKKPKYVLESLIQDVGEFGMRVNEIPTPSETPSTTSEAPAPIPKRFGRRLYFIIGLIAVVAVASAFVFGYLLPKGEATTLSVGLNYSKGERMTYESKGTVSALGQTVPQEGAIDMEVLDFDGENYTISYTVQSGTQEFSYSTKVNKTGYILEYSGLPPEYQQMYSSMVGMPGFGSYFQKEEVKVGESFQIPIYLHTENFLFIGIANYRISEIKSITVPAGTYDVFRMDTTAFLFGDYNYSGATVDLVGSMSAYGYVERGTSLPVEYNVNMQMSVSMPSLGQTMNMGMTMQLQLTEHTKP